MGKIQHSRAHQMSLSIYNPFAHVRSPSIADTPTWCEQHLYISSRVPTSEPGAWKRATVSAWCLPGGPLEALDDPAVEMVVVAKGAQVAGTTVSYSWLAKSQATDPGSALIVMNSTSDARDKSDETWRPLWEDSPKLARFLPKNRRRDWTKLFQRTNAAPVYWIGANSPGRLGAKPIRRLIIDERDKYPRQFKPKRDGSGKSEAGAAELAIQRVKSFRKKGMAKIFMPSTPTDERGIWQDYLNGDQRKLFCVCPYCHEAQILTWAHFKIDMTLAKEEPALAIQAAHAECQHCKQAWTDDDRYKAIDAGAWKPTATAKDPKSRTFHFPSWCSKFVTHSYLATQWIGAQTTRSKMQDFINSECGEPYQQYENNISDSIFQTLEGGYNEGERWTPDRPEDSIVIAGCDVQKGYLVPAFRLFNAQGDNGLLWAGDVADLSALDQLAEKYDAKMLFLDARYRTQEINEWCASHRGYIPCMGVSRRAKTLFSVSMIDLDEGRRSTSQGRLIETLSFDPDMAKDILADQLQQAPGARRWMIPRGYSAHKKYVEQMKAEKNINGHWIPWPVGAPNHIWDAEVLCLVGAIRLGLFKLAEELQAEQKEKAYHGERIDDPAQSV